MTTIRFGCPKCGKYGYYGHRYEHATSEHAAQKVTSCDACGYREETPVDPEVVRKYEAFVAPFKESALPDYSS